MKRQYRKHLGKGIRNNTCIDCGVIIMKEIHKGYCDDCKNDQKVRYWQEKQIEKCERYDYRYFYHMEKGK